jgi:aldehyde dehydrogenase (NAD+)
MSKASDPVALAPLKSFIDGRWVLPVQSNGTIEAINPATETIAARVALCGTADVDLAVTAARRAFTGYSVTTVAERIDLVRTLIAVFERRYGEMVEAITTEMGAPHDLSFRSQAECGPGHLKETITAAQGLEWERPIGSTGKLVHEAIGVCVLITPWNWPINQLAAKIGPALLAGCTIVLKPSEIAPLSAQLFAEFIDEAGFPAGVFNMLHGTGAMIGDALTGHPEVDMVSFTGSTSAGIKVAKSAADTVKRVAQELGGKSPNVIFADVDLEAAITRGVLHCFNNSGQSCNAPTRMLVEASVYDEAVAVATRVGASVKVGDPRAPGSHLGPVVSKAQYEKIQRLVQAGIDEGARIIVGGTGKPDGFEVGYYVKPTIFAGVDNSMTIAQAEVFGPVLVMIPFADEADAIAMANDTPFGLASYVQCADPVRAVRVARAIRAGSVHLNGAGQDYCSPFGGYKQSGNGREWGVFGLEDYLERKVINGFPFETVAS